MTGTIGFALIFQTSAKRIPFVAGVGAVTFGVYLGLAYLWQFEFISNLGATFTAYILSYILAKILKTPYSVFFTPGIISLVPGSGLYYTMSYLLQRDYSGMTVYLYATVWTGLGIAAGIILATTACYLWERIRNFARDKIK